jgi:hypothetical protein
MKSINAINVKVGFHYAKTLRSTKELFTVDSKILLAANVFSNA